MITPALVGAVTGSSSGADQTPVFPASVEVVYVDAFVTQGGRPLRGLAASDFELRDEGVVRPVELVAMESLPLLALLVFDTSGSVAGEKLAALRAAAESFLDIFGPADEIGLLSFSEEIAWRARPARDRAVVKRPSRGSGRVERLPPGTRSTRPSCSRPLPGARWSCSSATVKTT